VIAKAGKPYLDLLPHKEGQRQRTPGRYKGQIHMAEDFDQTPEDVISAFEGEG
jgi:antitoxin (DNA-binding transcriptional repressor) of toxin-antitoxin stability system